MKFTLAFRRRAAHLASRVPRPLSSPTEGERSAMKGGVGAAMAFLRLPPREREKRERERWPRSLGAASAQLEGNFATPQPTARLLLGCGVGPRSAQLSGPTGETRGGTSGIKVEILPSASVRSSGKSLGGWKKRTVARPEGLVTQ